MNLKELVSTLKECSFQNPLIKTFVSDIGDIDGYNDLRYSVIAIDQGLMSIENGFMNVALGVYYIDRLVDSPGDSSKVRQEDVALSIQSRGVDVLHSIFKSMPIGYVSCQYQPFTHRFRDLCAGVLAQVEFRVPYSYCWDDFAEAD